MIIDFSQIAETSHPQFKGGEGALNARMYFDGKCRIMKGSLAPGSSIGIHTHETNCEVIILTSGTASVLYDGTRLTLHAGDIHYCPMGHTHSLVNDSKEDITFTAIVPEQTLPQPLP